MQHFDNRTKIMRLYRTLPAVALDDRVLTVAFWKRYDGLERVIGEEAFEAFARWFIAGHATLPESIRRSRQSLTEHGQMPQPEQRAVRESSWRGYWGEEPEMKEGEE